MTAHGVDRTGAAGGQGEAITPIDEQTIDAKGDLLVGTAANTVDRLAAGANDTFLIPDSSLAKGLKWVAAAVARLAMGFPAIAAKGDLLVGTAADTIAKKTVGADGTVLTADSTQTDGTRWAASPGFSTGDVKVTYKTVADSGWVMMNDGTIGNAASGGTTRANADTVDLFTLLWNNTLDANCAVSGGRGGSAAADYAANKTIALPKALGRDLAVSGAGSGLTSRALASIIGVETITTSHLPASGLSIPSLSVSVSGSIPTQINSVGAAGNRLVEADTGTGSADSLALGSTGSTGTGTTGNMGTGGQFLNPRQHANLMIKL